MSAIDAGYDHTCALLASGAVKCWGYNAVGQLGEGTVNTIRKTPANVSGLTGGVVQISAGHAHTCAVTDLSGVRVGGGTCLGS